MATIRIAKITYDHHEVKFDKNGTSTIGEQVDNHIRETIKHGGLVSEVTFMLDGIEEQNMLAQAYAPTTDDNYAYAVPADDYYAKPAKKRG